MKAKRVIVLPLMSRWILSSLQIGEAQVGTDGDLQLERRIGDLSTRKGVGGVQTLSDGWTVPHRQLLDSQAGTALTTQTTTSTTAQATQKSANARLTKSQGTGTFRGFTLLCAI